MSPILFYFQILFILLSLCHHIPHGILWNPIAFFFFILVYSIFLFISSFQSEFLNFETLQKKKKLTIVTHSYGVNCCIKHVLLFYYLLMMIFFLFYIKCKWSLKVLCFVDQKNKQWNRIKTNNWRKKKRQNMIHLILNKKMCNGSFLKWINRVLKYV